jgi:hypothetical protein
LWWDEQQRAFPLAMPRAVRDPTTNAVLDFIYEYNGFFCKKVASEGIP